MGALWDGLQDLLIGILVFFYDLIPNFGIAIILLTLLISLLLFPLTLKQTRSMKAMSEIQPDVKALQAEHKGDREKLNQELMALYKERGVNPAAGCLPILLQMPIWFALFRVLRGLGEAPYRADHLDSDSALAGALEKQPPDDSFLGMNLLTSPSDALGDGFLTVLPYIILILVVMGTGYYQQYQTTARAKRSGRDPGQQAQQMQTIMKIFPIVFGIISWSLPAGLVLYFATSQIFRIGQQAMILKIDGDHHAAGASDTAKNLDSDRPAPRKADNEDSVTDDSVTEPEDSPGTPTAGQRRKQRKKKRK